MQPDPASGFAAGHAAPAAASSALGPPSDTGSQRGRFLVLEGIDGCGKTTQLEALAAWLPASGLLSPGARLIRTREPGATPLGKALRQLLLHADDVEAPCPTAELLLYAADRAQHVQCVILPALAAGHWVLSDRFAGSTAAYQGHGRGLDAGLIAQLEAIATAGLQPDLTLWLDLPLESSLARRSQRPADRIEAAGTAFLARVAAGFAIEAQRRGWTRIAADGPPGQVTAACTRALEQRLAGRPGPAAAAG